MRKRLLALVLTSVLLGLSACGNTDTEESKEADNVVTEESQETISTQETPQATPEASVGTEESGEETASTEMAPEESKEEISEEIPVPIPDVPLAVEMENVFEYYYEPGTYYLLMVGVYDNIVINGGDYSTLTDAVVGL